MRKITGRRRAKGERFRFLRWLEGRPERWLLDEGGLLPEGREEDGRDEEEGLVADEWRGSPLREEPDRYVVSLYEEELLRPLGALLRVVGRYSRSEYAS